MNEEWAIYLRALRGIFIEKGKGRGHWGHKGRKGKRGGSLPSKGGGTAQAVSGTVNTKKKESTHWPTV